MREARKPRGGLWLALIAFAPAMALGAGARVFVASTGIDGNPCTLSAPCRSLQYAVAAVDVGGEVIITDSAGYGPVTITKSVSVIAPRGIYAGVTVASGTGVDVGFAGAKVALEGLTITGTGAGTTGVRFASGTELRLVGCTVTGMTIVGLEATAAGARIYLHDTSFDRNNIGVRLAGTVAVLDNVRASANWKGLEIDAAARVAMRGGSVTGSVYGIHVLSGSGTKTTFAADSVLIAQDVTGILVSGIGAGSTAYAGLVRSVISHNTGNGVETVATAPATAVVTLTATTVSDNATGVLAQGDGATLLATGNTIARNTVGGLVQAGGATLQSLANNQIDAARAPPTGGTITTVVGY